MHRTVANPFDARRVDCAVTQGKNEINCLTMCAGTRMNKVTKHLQRKLIPTTATGSRMYHFHKPKVC